MIDLTQLYTSIDKISIDGIYKIPNEIIVDERIHELSEIELTNSIIEKIEGELFIKTEINGKMKISDSVSLEDVWYPFNIKIDEKIDDFIEKGEKYLDIIAFLWQNIVLEVPLRYSIVKDYSKYQGDGWKLVSEEELVNNNPFNTLLKGEDRSD